jgi:hypothetical protein
MPGPDWTSAVDAGLTECMRHCTLCGRQPVVWFAIHALAGQGIAYVLCQHCHRDPGSIPQIEALLAQRYGATRESCDDKRVL